MTSDDAIQQFGLPTQPAHRETLLRLLSEEIEREQAETGDQELLRTLCAQLFSIGTAEDSLAIWAAKDCNFDTMCGIDVQFLCGAGLEATKEFLATSSAPVAAHALKYLVECEQSGDFLEFSPAKCLSEARFYYHSDDSSNRASSGTGNSEH